MIQYVTDRQPTDDGVYACRVSENGSREAFFVLDKFLLWFEGKWHQLGTDVPMREEVIAWLGPLPRERGEPSDSERGK